MKNEQAQRRIIAAALFCTGSTALPMGPHEQWLAEAYIQGTLTLREAIALLEAHDSQQLRQFRQKHVSAR